MFLFDTDTITNLLKPRPSEFLLKRLKSLAANEQHISTITISEIVYGAHKSTRCEYHLKNLSEILLPQVNVVDFDVKAAWVAGQVRACLEKAGRPLSFADIQIAALALSNGLTLITGNLKHFERIPDLKVENWL
ncbi:MAG: type II toxin-antitoxin system VapC family toxin [Kiritimatiellae bacterium]|nr:type II toxin-antitoxin system VapC family toxin [Kiritimatiellia bacterium]MDD4735805.1 type II toxin-antitoxin system VapC family toxin [Kiritimatiellia bacterium]